MSFEELSLPPVVKELSDKPMGITLREIVYDIGGGIPGGKKFKAVQTGGPTGGWLSASALDLPVDYEHLISAGSIMGSGSMVVANSDACAVDLAKSSLSFLETESCGKCVFCREGTMQMAEILTDITEGRGRPHDIELLLKLGEGMKSGSFFEVSIIRVFVYENITVSEIKVPGWPPLNTPLFRKRVESILSRDNFDLIHIHHGACHLWIAANRSWLPLIGATKKVSPLFIDRLKI
jgi:hypothetical protein